MNHFHLRVAYAWTAHNQSCRSVRRWKRAVPVIGDRCEVQYFKKQYPLNAFGWGGTGDAHNVDVDVDAVGPSLSTPRSSQNEAMGMIPEHECSS